MYIQTLIWLPKGEEREGYSCVQFDPFELPEEVVKIIGFAGKPNQGWFLLKEKNQDKAPKLPFKPFHHVNAFIENGMHDFTVEKRSFVGANTRKWGFRYHGSSAGGCWYLLEWIS